MLFEGDVRGAHVSFCLKNDKKTFRIRWMGTEVNPESWIQL